VEWSEAALACVSGVWGGDGARGLGVGRKISRSLPWIDFIATGS
jgi:hypothetical protein